MSKNKRGNRKKGTMTRKITSKKKQKIDAMNLVQEDQVHPALQPLVQKMKMDQEQRVRYAEMKGLQQHQKVIHMLDEIKSNQIVLQTLLLENKTITREQFANEYHRYMTEVVGIVREGQMDGMVLIDTFNIGVTPKPNSINDIKNNSTGPIIINRS